MTLWGQCRNHSLSTPCVWVSPISLLIRPYCVPQFTFSEDCHLFHNYRLQLNSGHKLKLNLPKAIWSPLLIHPLFTSQPFYHSQTSVLFLDTHVCAHMWGCVLCSNTYPLTSVTVLNVFPCGRVNVYGHRSFCVSMCTSLWIHLWFFTTYHLGPKICVYSFLCWICYRERVWFGEIVSSLGTGVTGQWVSRER
jgi:hypothetical protein